MKILSSADWHINLHKKKIPASWQMNRYQLMYDKLYALEKECDVHVIAGDLFDEIPKTDDVSLLLSFLNSVSIPTLVIPGNHEATRKGKSFWEHFKLHNTIKNPLVSISVENERIFLGGGTFSTFPYGSVQTDNLPKHHKNDILVTHIRGEVPPHITAEYDFERLRPWELVLLGDLHFNHKYKDYSIYYPGSPVNTTFDRNPKHRYGVDIITVDPDNVADHSVSFVDLELPKLLRRTVSVGEELIANPVHHAIYEVTGSIDEIASVQKSPLLDKKMVINKSTESTLNLKDKSIVEELQIWMNHIGIKNQEQVLSRFNELGIRE